MLLGPGMSAAQAKVLQLVLALHSVAATCSRLTRAAPHDAGCCRCRCCCCLCPGH